MFGSFGAGFGSFGAGVGGLLPSFTNITSWLKAPTADGKTLANSKGADANLTGVNLLSFDGNNDEVNFGQALDFQVTDSWTTEFTIQFDSTPSSFQWIVGKEASSKGWAVRNGNSANREKLGFFILGLNSGGGSVSDVWQTDANVLDGTLATWKVVYDGSNASFYKNGVAVASSKITSGNVVNMTTTGASSLGQRSGSTGDISADVSNLKVYNNTTTYLHVPLAEGSGTKAYDVSGNGNHGVITGASYATKNGIASWNHEYGFDIDGSVKVPALNTKTTQVATFDGVADQINTGYNPSGDLIIDARIKADSVTGQKTLHQCNENAGYFFRISNGEWQLYVGNGYVFSTSTGIDPAVETLYDTRVEYTASSNAWVVKVKVATDSTYTTVGSGTRTPTFSSANFILGQKGNAGFLDGEYHSFKITDGGATKVEYDFQSDIGTTTVQDTTINNNDGTVTVGSGGTAKFWGTRIADTAGSLVSADYATGNTTISNPGGFVHNGSECGVDMVSNDKTATELFAIVNSSATETFVRKDNGNIVQILDYSAPLTGDDLTRTRNYVG